MSKKRILGVGLTGTLLFVIFLFANRLGICSYIITSCTITFDPVAETLFIFIPLFFLSLFVYRMQNEIFRSWIKFAYVWIPLTIIFTLLAPEYDNRLIPIEKGSVSFFMSLVFLIVSILIILVKYLVLHKQTIKK